MTAARSDEPRASRRSPRPVGGLLRDWRERRRLSQLELAGQANISTRHLSFVETGRAAPSRDMLLHLAEQLDVPLRERNALLLAAGFAPVYAESTLEAPELSAVREAVRRVLQAHEPFPALAIDRGWNLVEANAGVAPLLADVAPELLAPPANVVRISLHPRGLAPRIVNAAEWRAHLLDRLRRQIVVTGDAGLVRLFAEASAYDVEGAAAEPARTPGAEVAVPLRLRVAGRELSFLSTVTTFGTPLDVTVAELAIESFFPADAQTAAILRGE